jgi:hypothetical protein
MRNDNQENLQLRLFQVLQLFNPKEVENVLSRKQWVDKYLDTIQTWKSQDKLVSSRVLLAGEIVLTIARECTCVGDFYADPDGSTLHIVPHGDRPMRWHSSSDNEMVSEEVTNAKHISSEEAILNYGADAVWLAQEYGKSQKGERDNRFSNID